MFSKENLFKLKNEKNAFQRYILRRGLFNFFQWFGVSVVANHFYEPIPCLRELRKKDKGEDVPNFPTEALGWDFNKQENSLDQDLQKYGGEFAEKVKAFGYTENYYFQHFDAICLYVFLRSKKILNVVEFGQGFSSRVTAAALNENAKELGKSYKFTSIDPFSRAESQGETNDLGETKLLKSFAQDFTHQEINELLGENGLLFTDSSHVYKAGSDVEYQFREFYPNLPKNTYLHVHDIYMPYNWPMENIIDRKWFWNEQDFLQQFLTFNKSFQLELPVYWLHRDSKIIENTLDKIHPAAKREGYSIYLQRV